ncbi:MAG: hypothetical protein IKU19_07555 [Clostridia bacterium]|nr:hypothetical protein [Clostridia bacterium]
MEKREFSLLDVLQLLKLRWWILLLAAIIFASGAGVYSYMTYEPTYSSSVTVYVNDQTAQDTNTADDVSQVKWAKEVVNSYLALLKTNDFMEEISSEYQARFPDAWAERTYSAIKLSKSCVKYTIIEETYLFTFTVTTHDKEASYNMGKIFEELAPKKITEVTGKDAIKIADSSRVAIETANSRNLARNSIVGFLIGAILAFLIVLIVDVSDVRIKDEDDIVDTYNVPLLGSVPNFDSAKKKGYGYGKK